MTQEELLTIASYYQSGKSQKEIANLFGLDSRPDVISEIVTGRRFAELTGIEKSDDFTQRTTAKISDEDVMEILKSFYELDLSQKYLCEKYGMSAAQMSRIIKGDRRTKVYNEYFNKPT